MSRFEILDQVKAILEAEAKANGESLGVVYARMYGYCSAFVSEKEAKEILKMVKARA